METPGNGTNLSNDFPLRFNSGQVLLIAAVVTIAAFFNAGPADAGSLKDVYTTGTVKLDLSLEIGGDEVEDENAILYAPSGFAIDGAGNIYILDYKLHCIKVFDPSGEYIKTIGREGEGPGEFRGAGNMVIDTSGRIITHDFMNKRFQIFSPMGEYIDSRQFQEAVDKMAVGPDGDIYVGVQEFDFMDPSGVNTLSLLRMSGDMNESTALDSTRVKLWKMITVGNGMTTATVPYPPYLHWAVSANGNIIIGRSDEYLLRIMSADYEILGEIRREVEAPRITEADEEAYFKSFERDGNAGLDPSLKNVMKFPGSRPFFSDIVVDPEGNILVRWSVPVEDVPVYDVFEPNGKFIGRVSIDGLTDGAVFHGGFIYCRFREEDELPTIRRYSIPGLVAPGGNTP
jgi:hypothetical protein